MKLSVALATYNEEENIENCLKSLSGIADEIIVVDGSSTDDTAKVAERLGAKVITTQNHPIFHINKQKAFDQSTGDWILYLDADERVSRKLAVEIKRIINMSSIELIEYQRTLQNNRLFSRHQRIIEERDRKIGNDNGEYVAFYFPRLNFFLGKYLRYGGVYPDGVIRLFKKGKAYLPCKSVHEQMVVDGRVGWLQNDLLHIDSPSFSRYLQKNSKYIALLASEYERMKIKRDFFNFIKYCLIKPIWWFLWTQVRHKGILDGMQGIIFSLFSALRFPRAYLLYLRKSVKL